MSAVAVRQRHVLEQRSAAIALLALLLVGCPPTAKVSLYNGTAHTVIVSHYNDARSIPSGESRSFRVHRQATRLGVYSRDGLREYSLSLGDLPSKDFRNFWGGLFRIQREPDGRIFILKRGQRAPRPLAELEQPPGFPLEPVQ